MHQYGHGVLHGKHWNSRESRPGAGQTEDRAFELLALRQDRRIQLLVELAPDEPEDIADIEQALIEREPMVAAPKIGRNEPCPSGSGKKFKKCCETSQASTPS